MNEGDRLQEVFRTLLQTHGPQGWWPADDPFEVMIGAVLTQNTAWSNVERALGQLRARIPLQAPAILALDVEELAAALRPSGYFNVKARRLRALCERFLATGGWEPLHRMDTRALRQWLLATHGIGRETADDILLYAFARPVFVVDAYTRRLFTRLGLLSGQEDYEAVRAWCEGRLPADVALFQEYHALIVQHGKAFCRTRPVCGSCPLAASCAASRRTLSSAS